MISRHEDISCYREGYKYCSMVLLRRGYELFCKAPVVKNLGEISEILLQNEVPSSNDISGYYHSIVLLTDETLDAICMTAAFEFIAKGLLINERVAVHRIENNIEALKALGKAQRKTPIEVSMVLEQEKALFGANSSIINILRPDTLGLAEILSSQAYCKKIGFDKQLVEVLNPLVDRRNKQAHFFSICFEHNVFKSSQDYMYLKELIESRFIPMHNQLAKDAGFPEAWIINSQANATDLN